MKYLFIFFVNLAFYITFELIFNVIANIIGWYNMIPKEFDPDTNSYKERNKWKLESITSVWVGVVGGITGVILFSLFQIPILQKLWMVPIYSVLAGAVITINELIAGLILNVKFKLKLWNYSNEPFSFKGQISLFRSLGWIILGVVVWLMNRGITNLLK